MALHTVLPLLDQVPLFRGVDARDRQALLARPGCVERVRGQGSIVAFRGDLYERLLIVLSGSLSAELQNHRGKVLKVETLRRGEAVATAILFSSRNRLPVTLIASTETRLLEIPREAVREMFRRSDRFLYNFLAHMGDKLALLADKIYLLQFSTIHQKIAAYLLDEADLQGTDSPELKITREVLAEMFGVARPSLSRCLSELCRQGILLVERRNTHILDRRALQNLLEEV